MAMSSNLSIEGTKVQGVLINETPLRIGGERTSSSREVFQELTDSAILRRRGVPFIPGSSLKGFMRSYAEAILKAEGERVVYPYEDEESEEDKETSIVEELFGSKRRASSIELMDAFPISLTSIRVRTMVSIDRVFNGQQPGNLYNLDMIEPGSKFQFAMTVKGILLSENYNDQKVSHVIDLLKKILNHMESGFQLGGRKSTGLGVLRLTDIKYVDFKIDQLGD